ncbi:hypothetical protein JAAARDRAFT_32285 [Jaapia argillacea MUCL 33604]|uniref:Uncharacterized protein n=1 Tax=Jaapia argillacea MUCL 33604 TaxID=933084 RepID=A0A067Q556_9AGAM|nr:hypothetical protein JAAARDRAFT_32285 [Jaapia argillacea MUCL 33604]
MDPNGRHDMHSGAGGSNATPSRKRPLSRENETPSQRHKREKAAERQRRKRERDRLNSQNNLQGGGGSVHPMAQQGVNVQATTSISAPPAPQPSPADYLLSPEEIQRRDRVRAAARERQRKHRALVKQKKMRELGMDMGNEVMPGMEEVQYRMNADGAYQQVMPHEMHQPPPPPPHMGQHEPPFPQGQPLGGQTFASTLLLSFSCAPLLKQHLLRTLSMTNEELASLEPVIAHAWDQWDQQRRMHYAEQAAKAAGGSGYDHPGYPSDPSQPPPTDFRARFHRPLVAPSPFQAPTVAPSTPSSHSGSGPPSDPIDPNLTGQGEEQPRRRDSLDPELGQARGEAQGVAGKLERP